MVDVVYRQRFRRGAAGADSIGAVVREVLGELEAPGSEAARAAVHAGVDPAGLAGARVEVAEGEHGLEPILTTIVVSIAATTASKIVELVWTDVLEPRIRRRLGADALGRPVPDPPRSDPHPPTEDS
jgi:hypothetical protein